MRRGGPRLASDRRRVRARGATRAPHQVARMALLATYSRAPMRLLQVKLFVRYGVPYSVLKVGRWGSYGDGVG